LFDFCDGYNVAFSALTLTVGQYDGPDTCKTPECSINLLQKDPKAAYITVSGEDFLNKRE